MMNFEAACAAPALQGRPSAMLEVEPLAAPSSSHAVSTNRRLKALVAASMLPPAVAMTIFNRGMQAASACSESQWKRYLAEPGSERFQELSETLLAHAIHQFARIGVHYRASVAE